MIEWLQQRLQQIHTFVSALIELLVSTVPMPWRVSITLLIAIIIINLLVWRLLPWVLRLLVNLLFGLVELIVGILLWPEYLITRQMRAFGWGPLVGTYVYGGLLGGVVQLAYVPVDGLAQWQQRRFPWFLFILLAALPIGLWYARPTLQEMTAVHYIDVGFQQWYQLETWLLQKSAL